MKKNFWLVLTLMLSLVTSGFSGQSKMVQIKGSDTMVNLMQILAEEYMDKNPGIAFAVLGGGSGTGITALINRTCDIASHSREWRQKELDLAWEKGVKPRIFVVSIDGLAIIVNEKNPVNSLSIAQVGAIYRGEIKNWKMLGPYDRPISLYGRQSNSGTYVFMQEHVLGNKNYSTDMKEMNGNAQIIESIIQDEGGIGYVGVGYIVDKDGKIRKGLKVLTISKGHGGQTFSPLDKSAVESGAYPIARPLYISTNGKPAAGIARFIAWISGDEGQKIVEREGFYTIGKVHQQENEKLLK